ncbi:hypothetical protein [Halomonas stenophila]|uniref:Uncharacterized protein n=1 Tax=Halomonas stenophila TaxID=795312 RepID=A0A7W5EV94_9GAMM|nr:hypothetical protein [Halomonas stenophila]MBB3231697.1 hypothetical protein [Halomonas stenophila]
MGFWVSLAVAFVLNVIAYLLVRPKKASRAQAQDLREPSAEAGKPIPVVFGEITVTNPNVLYYGDVDKRQYEVSA